MAKPGKKVRRVLFAVEILLLLLFIGGLYVYGQINARMDKIETPVFNETKVVTNETAPKMTGYKTYALFGIDHRSKNAALGSDNSDTMIIASVNNDTKDVKLVSVYRDTLLNIGDDTYAKANAAYAYGGPEQAISMLNTNLDLNITDYATVDFNALVEVIDALGGLEIPLSYAEIEHMNNYCKETSEETGKSYTPVEKPEPAPEDQEAIIDVYHLNGVQATSYCRIRYTASLDMGRTERQRRVIQMIAAKAKKAGLTTIFNVMDNVFPMVKTSVSMTEILNMIPSVIGYKIDDTVGFPFNYKFSNVRGSIIVADDLVSNVQQLHEFLYGSSEGYTPSQNIVDTSAKIIEIVGGADNLKEEAPVVEDPDSVTNEFIWQDDGNGGNTWDSNPDYNPDANTGESTGESTETTDSETGDGGTTDSGTGGETVDPGTGGGETVDPGTGGGETVDPGTGGGETVDPGTGGGETVDPGTGGGETVDPGTGGGETVDPGTGGGETVDPGTEGTETVDPGTGGGEVIDSGGDAGTGDILESGEIIIEEEASETDAGAEISSEVPQA